MGRGRRGGGGVVAEGEQTISDLLLLLLRSQAISLGFTILREMLRM